MFLFSQIRDLEIPCVLVVSHKIIKEEGDATFIIELPSYQIPQLKNLLHTLLIKTKSFVFDAGKIIVAVSIIL